MQLAIETLRKEIKYHTRQVEENSQKIESKKESIELLKTANLKHVEILLQLDKAIKQLEKDIAPTMPIGKDSNDIITEVG